ncbi:unnamed protein product [Rotaria sordida]|uniref:Uncharacterized protein n=1 Tax=Rotaria sordida TaxID=392033 RepID=A0A813Y3H3_9BILA|nr:unnamed protein product [Rotaria sordida]
MIKSSRIFYQTYYLKHFYSSSTKQSSIPVIDLTKSYENETYCRKLVKRIDEICQNIGLFIITGHLIDAKNSKMI